MARKILEFEEPIAVLQKEIEALGMLPRTGERQREIDELRNRVEAIRREIYSQLTPWQQVQVARHPNRPHTLDYVKKLFSRFDEIHGDRRFGDDPAIVAGFAQLGDRPVLVIGHEKGRDTRQKARRNFGYARPEGYRKALRVMRLAEKFGRPVLIFVDTPAAYPGIESEERGVAEAIAYNLREMAMLDVPIIVIVTGEGGSGGALGLAIGDRVLIQEHAIYAVIPPEGCAAILWHDADRKIEAAEALKLTARDLLGFRVVDEVIPEPSGGAHADPDEAARLLLVVLRRVLGETDVLSGDERLDRRYRKFRQMGQLSLVEVEERIETEAQPVVELGIDKR